MGKPLWRHGIRLWNEPHRQIPTSRHYTPGVAGLDARWPALRLSITSSEQARIVCGIVSATALAVFRLKTSSNVVGCWTGRSAGLAPFARCSRSLRCARLEAVAAAVVAVADSKRCCRLAHTCPIPNRTQTSGLHRGWLRSLLLRAKVPARAGTCQPRPSVRVIGQHEEGSSRLATAGVPNCKGGRL
jgi:hypothetical protein